jgi:rare lipoprotein A
MTIRAGARDRSSSQIDSKQHKVREISAQDKAKSFLLAQHPVCIAKERSAKAGSLGHRPAAWWAYIKARTKRAVELSMVGNNSKSLILLMMITTALTGCQTGTGPFSPNPSTADSAQSNVPSQATSVKMVDRDVEAPEVFQDTAQALWDGRPSLGGVWVASPDAQDPERVIIRNTVNGKFVIGALFRRERDNPGPKLQISSDAAAALGLLAGAPATVTVTALRREEGEKTAPDVNAPPLDAAETVPSETLASGASDGETIGAAALAAVDGATPAVKPAKPVGKKPAVVATTLAAKPPIKPAPQSLADATTPTKPVGAQGMAPDAAAPKAALTPAAPQTTPALAGRTIQIGIFSIEANAKRAAQTLQAAGVPTTTRQETSQGKSYWSVTARGDAALLGKAKAAGFRDAYFLKG